jgi:hypothetical protein
MSRYALVAFQLRWSTARANMRSGTGSEPR